VELFFSICRQDCPLWREDGSVFRICCWPLPALSFSGPSPMGHATIFYCLKIWDFPFRRHLRLAWSRWMYSTPPSHGLTVQLKKIYTQNQSDITTDSQSVSQSWCRAPSGAHDQICATVWQLRSCSLWGALSDERTGLSFVHAAGPCQRSLPRVRVHWDLRPYFIVSDLRLSFSSPPTTRRATVRYSTPPPDGFKKIYPTLFGSRYIASARTSQKTPLAIIPLLLRGYLLPRKRVSRC
jgi:hypothetical protein